MILLEEIHCHTNYSHGKNTIEENVKAAIQKGMKKIVISEHGYKHYYAKNLRLKDYKEMKEEILRLRKKYNNIEILFGYEANILNTSGELDVDDEILKLIDVLYAGLHLMIVPNIKSILNLQFFNKINSETNISFLNKRQIDINTKAIINAINKYPIKMITHPNSRAFIDVKKVGEACAKKGVLLEINNSRGKLSAKDLMLLKDIDVNFAVGIDSHKIEDVGVWDVAKEILILSKIDLNRVVNVIK